MYVGDDQRHDDQDAKSYGGVRKGETERRAHEQDGDGNGQSRDAKSRRNKTWTPKLAAVSEVDDTQLRSEVLDDSAGSGANPAAAEAVAATAAEVSAPAAAPAATPTATAAAAEDTVGAQAPASQGEGPVCSDMRPAMDEVVGAASRGQSSLAHCSGRSARDGSENVTAAEALRNRDGERFVNELGRRDYVTGEMWKNRFVLRCLKWCGPVAKARMQFLA